MTPPLAASYRILARIRETPAALAAGAIVASVATHAIASVALPRPPVAVAAPAPRVEELEFVELAPLTPPPPAPAVEPEPRSETRGVATDERHEGGLAIARGTPLPNLVLSHVDRSGVFAVRDRLTLGDLTPRIVPRAPLVTPRTDESPPPESESAEDVGDAADPTTEDETIGPSEVEVAETTPIDPALESAEPSHEATPVARARSARTIAVELAFTADDGSSRDPRTETAALRFGDGDASLLLGLDRAVIERVVRVRNRGDAATVVAIRSSLPASELRARVEGAFASRNQVIEFDGDAVSAVARTTLDGRAIVLATVGSSIAIGDAADEASLDAALGPLVATGESLERLRLVGVVFDHGVEPVTRDLEATLVSGASATRLVLRIEAPDAPHDLAPDESLLARALVVIGLDAPDARPVSAPTWDGDVAAYELELAATPADELARRWLLLDR